MNTQKQIFLIVVLFFMFVGACGAYAMIDLPVRAGNQADWHKEESIRRGALLFANNCRTCHGNKGEGGIGPTLNKDEFKNQDPLVLEANIQLITRTLECGRAGTLMPAWLNENGGALNVRQIEHLVDLITAPGTEIDEETGNLTNKGWREAEEFAHNLNHETAVIVGGDTLDSIAAAHKIGVLELARLNNLNPNTRVAKGTKLVLPPTPDKENRTYEVKEEQTLERIADRLHVGAIVLANLNNIPYRYNEKENALTLLNEEGDPVTGLFPGTELRLPEYAVYVVRAGDTVTSIAEAHSLTESAIRNANPDFDFPAGNDEELAWERALQLPANTRVRVQEGDTVATIAAKHGLEEADLLAANEALTAETPLGIGQELALPEDAVYIVQSGDTLESIAAAHPGVTVEQLVDLNNIDPDGLFGPDVLLNLPEVDGYIVKGQTLAELAATFSNVRARELAEANGIPEDAILRIGQNLRLPDTAWGSAPSTTINPGTACLQHIVPQSVYEEISGTGGRQEIEKPEQAASELRVEAHANDWTFIIDGQAQQPNEGVALIPVGSQVVFTSVQGLHNIVLNGEVQGDDLTQGSERTITFDEPGEYEVTCDYHPDMWGYVFVE